MHGAMLATAIAEYFRDQGKHVLLLMDSLTRFAQAQREIGLAINEPPANSRAIIRPRYLPSSRNWSSGPATATAAVASITAFYTVLAEGDDQNDPPRMQHAILDGAYRVVAPPRRVASSIPRSISRPR